MEKTKKDNTKVLRRIFKELFNKPWKLILIIFCFIVAALLATVAPRLVGDTMTEIYNELIDKVALKEAMDFTNINKLLIILIAVYCINAFMDYIKNSFVVNACQKYISNLRKNMNIKILKLPIKYFEDKNNGEILSLLTNDMENINLHLHRVIREAFTDILNIIGACIMMVVISPKLIIIDIIVIGISLMIINIILKKSVRYFDKKQEDLSNMNAFLEENYTGRTTIQLFNRFDSIKKKFDAKNNELLDSTIKSDFFSSIAGSLISFLENVSIAVIAIVSAILNIIGEIEIGYIYTIISYTKTMTNPLKKIASIVREVLEIIVSSKRIYEFLDEEEEKHSDNEIVTFENSINTKSVYFSYENGKEILKEINVEIPKGKKIAIVGRTGSGKTTLAKLLIKIYTANKGTIEFDGKNVNTINTEEYTKNFGVINQDINLFNDTVMENIKYGNPEITDEEIIETAKQIGINNIILQLENGYNTKINDNDEISTGIKQLVVLLQNIVSKASILVFDEATNMLDNEIEEKIEEAMNYICKQKTLIIIAHKLKTIKDADYIYVVENGIIVEHGKHEQLIGNNSYYSKMYNN